MEIEKTPIHVLVLRGIGLGAIVMVLLFGVHQQIKDNNRTHPVVLYAEEVNGKWYPTFALTGNSIPAVLIKATRSPYLKDGMEVVDMPRFYTPRNAGLILLDIREYKVPYEMKDTRGAVALGILDQKDVNVVKKHTGIDIGKTNGIGAPSHE